MAEVACEVPSARLKVVLRIVCSNQANKLWLHVWEKSIGEGGAEGAHASTWRRMQFRNVVDVVLTTMLHTTMKALDKQGMQAEQCLDWRLGMTSEIRLDG